MTRGQKAFVVGIILWVVCCVFPIAFVSIAGWL